LIVKGDKKAIQKIVTKFISKTFGSKLGKKKISEKIKSTTKLCYNKSLQNYAQFLISHKTFIRQNKIMGDTPCLDYDFFDFFEAQPPSIHQWSNYLKISSPEELDFELLNILNYNLKYPGEK